MVKIEPLLAEAEQEGKVPREVWHLDSSDESVVKRLLTSHLRYTGSTQAKQVLDHWNEFPAPLREGVPERIPARAWRTRRERQQARGLTKPGDEPSTL